MSNPYNNSRNVRQIGEKNFVKDEEVNKDGYGNDFYEITINQLEKLKGGEVLLLDSQEEYGVYLRIKE